MHASPEGWLGIKEMNDLRFVVGLFALVGCVFFAFLLTFAAIFKPTEDTVEYRVSSFVCYFGDWTILHIDDNARGTEFYLAYHRTTRETVVGGTYKNLLEILS